MEIESLDHSPGSTLRTARRGVPEVTSLADSPGARRRASSRLEDAPARSTPTRLEQAPPRLNGHREDRGQVEDPYERPSSRNTVEITLSGSGRSRSRQDLCPDRPRSKFEHAVWREDCSEETKEGLIPITSLKRSGSTDKLTERIMILGDEHTEYMNKLMKTRSLHSDKYKSRTRPSTPVRMEDTDRRWLSSDSLSDFKLEDKWWLSGSCKSFLETKQTSFGHKKLFLIEKKPSPCSNPELSSLKQVKNGLKKLELSEPLLF